MATAFGSIGAVGRPLILFGFGALALAACAVGTNAPTQQGDASCPAAPDASQIALDYDAFDAAGWREWLAQGCTDAAVAQLEAYRAANAARLTQEQERELHFHVGQAYAFSGRDPESVPHFEQARGGDAEWSAYVAATLAFLRRDAIALRQARDAYALAPQAIEMRLQVIDGFIACPNVSYLEAMHCAMAHHSSER